MQCVGGTALGVGGRVHLENLATSMVESTDTSVPDQAWMELLATCVSNLKQVIAERNNI
jgi:hypothetical protein